MRAILVCPGPRKETAALAAAGPLPVLSILGKSVVEYWIEFLVCRGAREVIILASDRPDRVRAQVGDGRRWGLKVEVKPEQRELEVSEVRALYGVRATRGEWLAAPDDVTLMDHLPGHSEFPLFTSYADWVSAAVAWMPREATPDRIGVRQVRPGIWVGLHCRIGPGAELRAPCWIGEEVRIEAGAVIGPGAVLENTCLVGQGVEVVHSVVGPGTFVGEFTQISHSIAWGNLLMNCRLGSAVQVSDAFLLCPLGNPEPKLKSVGWISRAAALSALLVLSPLVLMPVMRSWWRRQPAWRRLQAVRPRSPGPFTVSQGTILFRELAGVHGWMKRWPQLWNVVRGDFAWVGNRPLSPARAARLSNEFEALWLASRPGLISLADTEEGRVTFNDAARAHSAFYSARAGRWLDCKILLRALLLLAFGVTWTQLREAIDGAAWRSKPRRELYHGDQTTQRNPEYTWASGADRPQRSDRS